jgi:hypothetical protein
MPTIEEMYGDMKGHGFDLEATHLKDAARISRLFLGICIVFVWLITLGSWVVKRGYRHLVDHRSRRDKSCFRIGWDWIDIVSVSIVPYRYVSDLIFESDVWLDLNIIIMPPQTCEEAFFTYRLVTFS